MINYLKRLFSAGGHDEADEAKRQEERDFDLLKYDGIRAMRMGKTDYAERCFTRAIGLRRDPETLRHLAALYIGLGRYDEAIATLTTLAEAEPDKPDAHISMTRPAKPSASRPAMPRLSCWQAKPTPVWAICSKPS